MNGSYSFGFDFAFLALLVLVLAGGFVLATFPYRLFRQSRQNWYRKDGIRSNRRTRREVKKLFGLLGELMLFPLIAVTVITAIVFVVHAFIIPIPLAADVAAMFSTDSVVWEERTETGELGDVGLIYGEWSDERGFSRSRAFVVRKFLKRNWLVLLMLGAACAALTYWFLTGYYVQCITSYNEGIIRRKTRYAEHDGTG